MTHSLEYSIFIALFCKKKILSSFVIIFTESMNFIYSQGAFKAIFSSCTKYLKLHRIKKEVPSTFL